MVDSEFVILKRQMAGTSDPELGDLRVKLEECKEKADSEIRLHQREINFTTKEYTVEHIVGEYSTLLEEEQNELFIPEYQRDFKWDDKRQSKFIESLMIGLPIPYIFTADVLSDDPEYDGRVEIVDGSQRVRTLYAFLTNELELQGLKLLTKLNGFKFEDLPSSRQKRFNRISIRIIELGEKCDEMTRRDLFERINSGSLELEEQEKRHGSTLADTKFYRTVLVKCSELDLFHELAPVSEAKKKSGEYKELVLRFFSYLNNKDKYKGTVAPFLNEYLENFKGDDSLNADEYISEFGNTLNFVKKYFPHGFKKTASAKSTRRTRFESIAVGSAIALREMPDLVPDNVINWLYSDEFKKATTSDGANNVGNFHKRINFVVDKLLGK